MNPILAFVLTVVIVHVILIAIHAVLAAILAIHIIATTGKVWMSHDELGEEIQQRALGRFVLSIYPLVFWWLLWWEDMNDTNHD